MRFTLLAIVCCVMALVQTPKTYTKNGLSFDYPADWTLQEGVNDDAQQLTLGKANGEVQISVFAHKGRIAPEKLPDAKKARLEGLIAVHNLLHSRRKAGLTSIDVMRPCAMSLRLNAMCSMPTIFTSST